MTNNAQLIQAWLLVAGDNVAKKELAKIIQADVPAVDEALAEIDLAFDNQALALVVTGNTVQLSTKPEHSEKLRLLVDDGEAELSRPALETLSIVAYLGPISRSNIDVIRGVDSRRMLRVLVSRGLVNQKGNNAPTFTLTTDALRQFGVTSNNELPDYETVTSDERISRIIKEDAS